MSSDEIKIRPARRSDREAIAALFREIGVPDAADPNTFLWVVNHPEVNLIVAADRMDRVVGVVTLAHRPQLLAKGRVATIMDLIVTGSWRRRGVGTKLLSSAIARAKGLSARRVELSAPITWGDLDLAYFSRRGFVRSPIASLQYVEPVP